TTDLCRTAEVDRERQLANLFARHACERFDLEHGPVLRATLVCVGNGRSALVLSVPTLCGDIRSLHRIVSEMAAHCAGAGVEEGEEPLRYVQFAQWQNDLLESEDENCEAGRKFWSKQGLGELPEVMVPGEHSATQPLVSNSVSLRV